MRVQIGRGEFRAHVNRLGISVQWWPIRNLKHYTLTLWFNLRGRPALRRYGAWE